MLKYILILVCSFLCNTTVLADDVRPNILGIKLGSSTTVAAKACRKNRGVWLASHLNLFVCKGKGFRVTVEANGDDIITSMYASFNQVKIYNEELDSFILNYGGLRSTKTGANNTVINEFSNDIWVVNFMSYGENGNYTAHLYNIKDMLNK